METYQGKGRRLAVASPEAQPLPAVSPRQVGLTKPGFPMEDVWERCPPKEAKTLFSLLPSGVLVLQP